MKKIKLTWNNLILCLAFIFMIIPLICLAGAGFTIKASNEGFMLVIHDTLAGFMGGSHSLVTTGYQAGTSATSTAYVVGGYSVFGLISLILLVLSIVGMIVVTCIKKPKLRLYIAPAILLSGIFIFLLLVAGSELEGISFKEFYASEEGISSGLGAGAICYGIFAIISSGLFIANSLMKKDYFILFEKKEETKEEDN